MYIAYFLSHNGLGDNINNIGAIRYLLDGYYDEIYFICKEVNLSNLQLLYPSRVHFITVNSQDEMNEYRRILAPIYSMEKTDILVSGPQLRVFYQSKITNQKLLTRKKMRCYWIQQPFDFIREFYEDIYLDLGIYYNFFQIDDSPTSLSLYDEIKQYNVIFAHAQSSNGPIDLTDTLRPLIHNDSNMVICADHNMYDLNGIHYALAEKYVNRPLVDYITIINHASHIYVVDSCFSAIVIPLLNMGKLNTVECRIFNRHDAKPYDLSYTNAHHETNPFNLALKIDQQTHNELANLLGKAFQVSM
jgi:hypothetical protein